MKKFLVSVLLLAVFASCSYAEVVGTLTKLNSTPQGFRMDNPYTQTGESIVASLFAEGIKNEDISFRYYDSIMMMLLALSRGNVDSIVLPEFVGNYMLRNSNEYDLHGFVMTRKPIMLSFGFMEDKTELRDRINAVIDDMSKSDLELLVRDYVTGFDADNPPAVEFAHFDDAATITVAVTGDMPPLDYIAEDGRPVGFNTALLAEIGRRLHVNINLANIETGARVAALKSGRADVVFWFAVFNERLDVPEGVILSKPYYGWNKVYFLGRKGF